VFESGDDSVFAPERARAIIAQHAENLREYYYDDDEDDDDDDDGDIGHVRW